MRKAERQISDTKALESILRQGTVLRLAMCREGQPYLVPLNYAYDQGVIYLHAAWQGLKIQYLESNPRVCFEVSIDIELRPGSRPCQWTCLYRSVIGFGLATVVAQEEERIRGLRALAEHYAGGPAGEIDPQSAAKTCVVRIDIQSMTGKQNRP